MFGVATALLVAWQAFLGDRAMVPPSIVKSKSVIAIICFNLMVRFTMLILTYVGRCFFL